MVVQATLYRIKNKKNMILFYDNLLKYTNVVTILIVKSVNL